MKEQEQGHGVSPAGNSHEDTGCPIFGNLGIKVLGYFFNQGISHR
jgi:hypothetical protein